MIRLTALCKVAAIVGIVQNAARNAPNTNMGGLWKDVGHYRNKTNYGSSP